MADATQIRALIEWPWRGIEEGRSRICLSCQRVAPPSADIAFGHEPDCRAALRNAALEAYARSLEQTPSAAAPPLDLQPLKDACDRDWLDETPQQIVAIAANAIFWRQREIEKLQSAAPPSDLAKARAWDVLYGYTLPDGIRATMNRLLADAAASPAPPAGWQPMSVTPPRCTHYLITDGKGEYHVAYWAMPDGRRMHWTGYVANKQGFEVTHWMPLPASRESELFTRRGKPSTSK